MIDVRLLLKDKEYIETAMQRADPLMRVVMQRRLDRICKELKEARIELNKLFEPQETDQMRARVTELEASNKKLLDALEDFVIDVEGYFGFSELDDIQPKNDMAYFIGEYRTAKNLIKKARGLQ